MKTHQKSKKVVNEAAVEPVNPQGEPKIDSSSLAGISVVDQTVTPTPSPNASFAIDLQALRLPANYGATFGVKKLLTKVPVGKAGRAHFFRTHSSEDMVFSAMTLEQKESRETYVVAPDVAQQISELVRPVQLHASIDRHNNVFLTPITLPGEDGSRNPWHESLAQAVELAKTKWIRITANMHVGAYDVYEAQSPLSEPEWPPFDIFQLIEIAFRGKIIDTLDHPVVDSLLGRI